jgi:hypothetical protein
MGKWVHGSVHEEVFAADLERLGALKLHDAPAHCNGVKHEQWVSLNLGISRNLELRRRERKKLQR